MSTNGVRLFSDSSGILRKDLDELSLHLHAQMDQSEMLRAQLALLAAQLVTLTAWQRSSFWARVRWLLCGI